MLANLNTDVNELASVIRLERALAARILQVSNSAYVGLATRASSIEEAVSRLGFREVRRIVTLVIGLQIMERPLPAYGIDARTLWMQSIACGMAAEELARRVDEDTNSAYALGLLHSVGMVVVNAWATLVSKGKVLENAGYPDDYTQSERNLLGFTNADTGAALLRRWDFPPAVVEPVRAQYQPVLAASHTRLAHLLLVARWLRTSVLEPNPLTSAPDPRSLAALEIDKGVLIDVESLVRNRLEEASKLLNTN
jgi:HD-like signal output (HDOD) protein